MTTILTHRLRLGTPWRRLGPCLAALALAGCGFVEQSGESKRSVGQPAPDTEGQDLDGTHFRLSDYRGKVVLLDFWGDW
jgi:hypothetical protein